MSSQPANLIATQFELCLGRVLTSEELIKCESVAYNVFPSAAAKLIPHFLNEDKQRRFDYAYKKITAGFLKTSMRKVSLPGFKFEEHARAYRELCAFLGDGFGYKDLDEVAGLCKNATQEELRVGIRLSMDRGIRAASYIRAIIVGRRRVTKLQSKYERDKYKPVEDAPPTVTDAAPGTKSWKSKLEEAKSNAESEAVRREAEKKARIHRHGQGR